MILLYRINYKVWYTATMILRFFHLALAPLIVTLFTLVSTQSVAGQETSANVVVGEKVVFKINTGSLGLDAFERAEVINRRIERVLDDPELHPENLDIRADGPESYGIILDNFPLLTVGPADAKNTEGSIESLANEWTRDLRRALVEAKPLHHTKKKFEVSFLPLVLVSALTFLIPVLFSRFRRLAIPVIVGEILAGILIGKSGLNLISYNTWLQFLSEFGFAYLMFLIGLEVDVSVFGFRRSAMNNTSLNSKRILTNPLVIALIVTALTLFFSAFFCFSLSNLGILPHPWLMTIVLSTTSLGLVAPILKERGLTASTYGQTMLLIALVADLATMFLITVVAGWLSSTPTFKIFLSLVVVGAFAICVRFGRKLVDLKWFTSVFDDLSSTTSQVKVRGSLALMLIFVALSESLGTEVILGAFLAGVLIAIFTKSNVSDLHHTLEALGFGFFIPIFFIMVGARFDISAIFGSSNAELQILVLVLVAFAIKILAALPLRLIQPWRQTLASGFLLSSRLSLIIAAAEIGLRLGLFSDSLYANLVCVALVTSICGPLGFQALQLKRKSSGSSKILIVGGDQYGLLLAGRLIKQDKNVSVLTRKASATKLAHVPSDKLIIGDGGNLDDLKRAGIENANTVIACSNDDKYNEVVCQLAASFNVSKRVAVIQDHSMAQKLREDGVLIISPIMATLSLLEGVVSFPTIFTLLSGQEQEKRIGQRTLTNRQLAGMKLKKILWPGDVLVLSIQRENEIMTPDGETELKLFDSIVVIGSEDNVREALLQMI